MMKALILAAVLTATLAVPHPKMVQQEFDIFKSVHEKDYDSDVEELKRLAIFRDNLNKIEEHNKLYEQGLITYKLGVTGFADMTDDEFIAYVNTTLPEIEADEEDVVVDPASVNGPSSLDWRKHGVVTPVKNQKNCGSCYAFSSTGAMEGQYALKHKKLLSLSEQNLVDCTVSYGNKGCHGGSMSKSFNYVKDHGIALEQDYPYENSLGECRSFERSPVVVSGFSSFRKSVRNVQDATANHGPLAGAIHVSPNLKLYKGGIFDDDTCEGKTLNHAVLLVGYNSNSWTVKNSWGTHWGEGGYFRVTNRKSGCGIINVTCIPKVE